MNLQELAKENEALKIQLQQAAQILQNREIDIKKIELSRLDLAIKMYEVLLKTDVDASVKQLYLNDITDSLVRLPETKEKVEEVEVEEVN